MGTCVHCFVYSLCIIFYRILYICKRFFVKKIMTQSCLMLWIILWIEALTAVCYLLLIIDGRLSSALGPPGSVGPVGPPGPMGLSVSKSKCTSGTIPLKLWKPRYDRLRRPSEAWHLSQLCRLHVLT